MSRKAAIAAVFILQACAPLTSRLNVTRSDDVTEREYMKIPDPQHGGVVRSEWQSLPSFAVDHVRDEARVTRVTDSEVCFDMVFRTLKNLDRSMDAWSFWVNGIPAQATNERFNVREYTQETSRTIVEAEGVSRAGYNAYSVSVPDSFSYYVVERQASLCAPLHVGEKKLALVAEMPVDFTVARAHIEFEW